MATAKDTFGRDYAFGTLMNYGYVAGRVETSRRREVLSWSHHYEIAKLASRGAGTLVGGGGRGPVERGPATAKNVRRWVRRSQTYRRSETPALFRPAG